METLIDPEALGALNVALRECAPSTRRELLRSGQLRWFEEGTLLFSDGDSAAVAIFPLRGAIQMVKATHRGRRQIICSPSGESCGGLCLLALGENSLADVRGLRPGQVLVVGRETFQALTHVDPALCRCAWQSASNCMAHLSNLVTRLSFSKVSERVATALLEATHQDGDTVRLTQADLAAAVGTTREVVARCLAGLQADGVIHLGRGRIDVLRRDQLLVTS